MPFRRHKTRLLFVPGRPEVKSVQGALKAWVPVFAYAGLIFWFSSLPGECVPCLFPAADKAYHFLEYLPFGMLLARGFSRTTPLKAPEAWAASLAGALIYAFSDEVHQIFVTGRQFSSFDLFADAAGALTGSYLYIKRWRT